MRATPNAPSTNIGSTIARRYRLLGWYITQVTTHPTNSGASARSARAPRPRASQYAPASARSAPAPRSARGFAAAKRSSE